MEEEEEEEEEGGGGGGGGGEDVNTLSPRNGGAFLPNYVTSLTTAAGVTNSYLTYSITQFYSY
jgi:hypothetical protein